MRVETIGLFRVERDLLYGRVELLNINIRTAFLANLGKFFVLLRNLIKCVVCKIGLFQFWGQTVQFRAVFSVYICHVCHDRGGE